MSHVTGRTRKRAIVVLAAGAMLPIGLAGPASAADIPDGTPLPGGIFCPFTVVVTDVANNRHSVTSTSPDGSTVVRTTGRLVQRLTNESTGKSIVVDLSGPTTDITSADGLNNSFVGTGHNLLAFGPHGRFNTQEPAVVVTTGRVKVTATSGTAQTFQLHGRQDNVCELLAP